MKRSESAILLQTIVRILVYTLAVVVAYFLIYFDAIGLLNAHFDENSFTEWGQELAVIGIMLTFAVIGYRHADKLPLAILGSGLSLMVLIREYNNFFKANFFQGAWSLLVLLTGILTVVLILKRKENFVPSLANFFASRSFGLTISGALITFVFSRLFGLPYVWRALMQENYIRPVIRAAEEGTELVGYIFVFFGVLEYAQSLKKKNQVPLHS